MNLFFNLIHSYGEIVLKIFICTILTGLIGYNREKNGMTVGIRTHILVGLSAVTVQVMALTYMDAIGAGTESVLRVSSSFTQAIGFIGAGAIIKDSRSIKGLTTAASIFFVACIGLSVGLGVYGSAILITFFAYLFLTDVFGLKKLISTIKPNQVTLSVDVSGLYNEHAKEITSVLDDIGVDVDYIEATAISMEKSKIIIRLGLNEETTANDVLSSLINIKSIIKTEIINNK